MGVKEEVEKGLDNIKQKYGLEGFKVEVVKGMEASIGNDGIKIGQDNPLELIECITMHEAYHIILQINQTEDFKEKDKGNIVPYLKTKVRIWNQMKEDFPELKDKIEAVSRIYRHFLNEGRNIYVNFKKVELMDPLCRLENHRFNEKYGVEKLYTEPIIVPINYFDEEGKKVKSNVVVEVVLLDYAKISDDKQLKDALNPSIPTQGFYLIRNKREINNTPEWYGAASYKYDWYNYIRGEIRFDSALDSYFGIGHNKSRAYPRDVILDAIKSKVSKIVSMAKSEHLRKKKQKDMIADSGSEMAKKIYESGKSNIKTKIDIEKGRVPDKKKEITTQELEIELFDKIDKDPTIPKEKKEISKGVIKKILEDKYGRGVIISSDGPNAPIFRVEVANGKQIIMVNGNHKFYEYVYEVASKDPYAYPLMDLVFYILAEIREAAEDDQTLVDLFDEIINLFSRKYGAMLGQKEFAEVIAAAKEKEES